MSYEVKRICQAALAPPYLCTEVLRVETSVDLESWSPSTNKYYHTVHTSYSKVEYAICNGVRLQRILITLLDSGMTDPGRFYSTCKSNCLSGKNNSYTT